MILLLHLAGGSSNLSARGDLFSCTENLRNKRTSGGFYLRGRRIFGKCKRQYVAIWYGRRSCLRRDLHVDLESGIDHYGTDHTDYVPAQVRFLLVQVSKSHDAPHCLHGA